MGGYDSGQSWDGFATEIGRGLVRFAFGPRSCIGWKRSVIPKISHRVAS